MNCKYCSNELSNNSMFCSNCGKSSNDSSETNVKENVRTEKQSPIQPEYEIAQETKKKTNQVTETKKNEPLSFLQSLITVIVFFIPAVNLIMVLVWSFRKNTNESRKNLSRALLLFTLVCLIVAISLGVDIIPDRTPL